MASSQRKALLQLRNYFSLQYLTVENFQALQKDLVKVLRLSSTKNQNDQRNANIVQPEKELKDLIISPPSSPSKKALEPVEKTAVESGIKYTDVKKAFQALNGLIPDVGLNLKTNSATEKKEALPHWMTKKGNSVSKSSIDARTRHLIRGLDASNSDGTNLRRIEDICIHLKHYPFTAGAASKCSGVNRLLKILHTTSDSHLIEATREVLSLIGYANPVKADGIRILSIDGGGTRGLVALELLTHLETKTGKPIHELFDLICGVSTGAVVAVLVGAQRLALPECRKLYRGISNKVFSQTRFKGTTNLMWKNSFYDSDVWTEILKEKMGDIPMIDTSRDAHINKLCLVSTQANANWIKPFLFRNYNFPTRVASHFNGSSSHKMWEGVRASAAAPAYFSEFRIEDLVLLDGGILVNNPTSIGIHEALQIWPDTPIQSVVSIGTGRHEPLALSTDKPVNWAMRLRSIVNSATDTEGVHTTLHDLLPGDVYFRLNPYLSEDIALDEIREDKLAVMLEDTNLYLRKNDDKINKAVESLLKPKSKLNNVLDSVKLKRQIYNL